LFRVYKQELNLNGFEVYKNLYFQNIPQFGGYEKTKGIMGKIKKRLQIGKNHLF